MIEDMTGHGPHKAGLARHQQGDFTAKTRILWIALLAVFVGAICSFVALALFRMIDFFTNLFYYQTFSLVHRIPAYNSLGWLALFVPVVGGLIIGLMARYGSERIRGHGIPEALEAILFGSSRISPRVAVLKPLSSAISIGAGGPFGAEGPIIMTGAAFGSIIAQLFKLTAAERKTLLAAGAAGGMTAAFNTPIAAVLLAVELLLFELKPRSLIPVAVACCVAAAIRPFLLEPGTYIHDPIVHTAIVGWEGIAFCGFAGLFVGAFAMLLTLGISTTEDLYHRVKGLHWMWWPAIGGVLVGVGGLLQPHVLGVGTDVIEGMLHGKGTAISALDGAPGASLIYVLLPFLLVKGFVWSTALGSGTSGGEWRRCSCSAAASAC